jgi:hypothetical protein
MSHHLPPHVHKLARKLHADHHRQKHPDKPVPDFDPLHRNTLKFFHTIVDWYMPAYHPHLEAHTKRVLRGEPWRGDAIPVHPWHPAAKTK